ncbi:MAG: hypothetical protein Q8Q09_19435 [Deltaproteobacteria bacterium]|nr:hypothetical protein [Deltaproteobacteria bacterium]
MNTLPHWLRVTRTLALGTLSLASTLAACESRTSTSTAGIYSQPIPPPNRPPVVQQQAPQTPPEDPPEDPNDEPPPDAGALVNRGVRPREDRMIGPLPPPDLANA